MDMDAKELVHRMLRRAMDELGNEGEMVTGPAWLSGWTGATSVRAVVVFDRGYAIVVTETEEDGRLVCEAWGEGAEGPVKNRHDLFQTYLPIREDCSLAWVRVAGDVQEDSERM